MKISFKGTAETGYPVDLITNELQKLELEYDAKIKGVVCYIQLIDSITGKTINPLSDDGKEIERIYKIEPPEKKIETIKQKIVFDTNNVFSNEDMKKILLFIGKQGFLNPDSCEQDDFIISLRLEEGKLAKYLYILKKKGYIKDLSFVNYKKYKSSFHNFLSIYYLAPKGIKEYANITGEQPFITKIEDIRCAVCNQICIPDVLNHIKNNLRNPSIRLVNIELGLEVYKDSDLLYKLTYVPEYANQNWFENILKENLNTIFLFDDSPQRQKFSKIIMPDMTSTTIHLLLQSLNNDSVLRTRRG